MRGLQGSTWSSQHLDSIGEASVTAESILSNHSLAIVHSFNAYTMQAPQLQ